MKLLPADLAATRLFTALTLIIAARWITVCVAHEASDAQSLLYGFLDFREVIPERYLSRACAEVLILFAESFPDENR